MTTQIIDLSQIDLTGGLRFNGEAIGAAHYNGERLWPFGVDLLYTGGIGGASYLPDLDRAFSSFYADAPGSFGGSIAALEATNDREPLNYSDIFLAGNQGDAFVVAPAYCFTDLAGTIQAGEGDVVLAMRGVVKGTLITQSDPASQPVLEKDARGVWSLRCNGNKFLRSSELFTVAANFTATVAMSVLSLTGIPGGSHVFGPILGTSAAAVYARASVAGGASTVAPVLRIAGGMQFSTSVASAFQVGVPFVATGMHEGSTITARQGDLLFSSAAANAGTGTAQANLQLGVSGGYDARFYGGVYINRALSQTERMRIEKRMKLDFGIRPDGAIASGQLSASLRPLLGRAPKRGKVNSLAISNPAISGALANATVVESDGGPFGRTQKKLIINSGAPVDDNARNGFFQMTPTLPSPHTLTFVAKPAELNGLYFRIGNTSTSRHAAYVRLSDGAVISQVGGATTWGGLVLKSVEPLANGFSRYEYTYTLGIQQTLTIRGWSVDGSASSNDGANGVYLDMVQLEPGAVSTAHQEVIGVEITEEGAPSYPFVRFDLSDDRLDTVLPQAVTGDVVIAGRNGSVIAPQSYAENTTFQLGPTSYTGGTPGILRAIGDVVGWSILDKTLTAAERERLMRFYKRRGAKGLLVPGPELVINGGFDTDSDWGKGIGWSIAGGVAIASNPTEPLFQAINLVAGRGYQVSFTVSNASGTGQNGARVRFLGGTATGFLFQIGDGTMRGFLTANAGNTTLSVLQVGNDDFFNLDNVSVIELRPEEEW